MSIRKIKNKDGSIRWMAQVYIGTDADGKRMYQYGERRDRQSDAKNDEFKITQQIERRRVSGRKFKITTFNDALAAFKLSKKYESYATRTKTDFEYYERKCFIPIFGNAKLYNITTAVIERWINEMEKTWSRATWIKPYNFFKAVMQFCAKRGYIQHDPCEAVELTGGRKGSRALSTEKDYTTWSPQQVISFLSWAPVMKDHCYLMIRLAFALALRPGEICGIHATGVLLDHIQTKEGIDRDGNITYLKNDLAHRTLPIDHDLYLALKKLANIRIARKQKYLFLLPNGNIIRPDVYSNHFRKLMRKYNETFPQHPLPAMPPYNARHTWSTNAKFIYHIDPSIRAAVLGHSSVDTSDRNYTNISTTAIQTELKKMGKNTSQPHLTPLKRSDTA